MAERKVLYRSLSRERSEIKTSTTDAPMPLSERRVVTVNLAVTI